MISKTDGNLEVEQASNATMVSGVGSARQSRRDDAPGTNKVLFLTMCFRSLETEFGSMNLWYGFILYCKRG